MQFAIGKHVFFPELLPGAVDGGRGVMRIERAAAQAGKMLPAAERSCLAEAGEEGFRVGDDASRIAGDDACAHHFDGSGGAQIEHGGEGDIEAEQPQFGADEVAVLAIELSCCASQRQRQARAWAR